MHVYDATLILYDDWTPQLPVKNRQKDKNNGVKTLLLVVNGQYLFFDLYAGFNPSQQ